MKERDRFKDEEEIKWLYEKIGYTFEEKLVEVLRRKQILPEDKQYNITPDFDNIEKWKISTNSQKTYTAEGPSKEKEDIQNMKGSLHITKGGLKIDPPFDFEFNVNSLKIAFNPAILRKIIKEEIQKEEWSVHSLFGEDDSFTVYDKEKDKRLEKLKEESLPLLKSIGFSNDEAGLMVLGAMGSNKFTDDITPEGVVGLALRIRGDGMLDKG